MKVFSFCFCAALFLVLSGVFAYGAEGTAGGDGKALFEQKCNVCHSKDRATKKLKTANEWGNTVMRMKNANGAGITDSDAKIIIDYLAKNYSLR